MLMNHLHKLDTVCTGLQNPSTLTAIFANANLGSVAASNVTTTAPTPSPPPPAAPASKKRFSGGAVAGIVIGCVVGVTLLYLIGVAAALAMRRRKRRLQGTRSNVEAQVGNAYTPMEPTETGANPSHATGGKPGETAKSGAATSWLPAFLRRQKGIQKNKPIAATLPASAPTEVVASSAGQAATTTAASPANTASGTANAA